MAPAATTSTYTVDLAGNFAKGIKLDESKFPKLENQTNFIVWKRNMKATAKMLGVWKGGSRCELFTYYSGRDRPIQCAAILDVFCILKDADDTE